MGLIETDDELEHKIHAALTNPNIFDDEKIKEDDSKKTNKKAKTTSEQITQNPKRDLFDERMQPIILVTDDGASGSGSGSERRSSVIIHKSDSDEIKVSEAAATVTSEINESANGAVKSVFVKKRKKRKKHTGKSQQFLLSKKIKNGNGKRQSTPNFHAAKSAKSAVVRKRKYKRKKNVKRSRPKPTNASSAGGNTSS